MDHLSLPLPLRASVRIFEYLSIADSNALVRAYPGLAHVCARTRSWQARLPVEIVQAVFAHLRPADYYAACRVCAFWRGSGMNARMLKRQLDLVAMKDSESPVVGRDLATDATAEELWRNFVVAAPRRNAFKNDAHRVRRHRVVSLDLRRPLARENLSRDSGVFMSDYGGIIAVSAEGGLLFYSIEDMLPQPDWTHQPPSSWPSASDVPKVIGTLQHPRDGGHNRQLIDVSIPYQQGSAGHFHIFALYDGGGVFRAAMQLVELHHDMKHWEATFTRFVLMYAGPPATSTVLCDWRGIPPPAWFSARHIDAVAPPPPDHERAVITLMTSATAYALPKVFVARVRTEYTPSPESVGVRRARKPPPAWPVDASRLSRDHPGLELETGAFPPPTVCALHLRGTLLVAAHWPTPHIGNAVYLYEGPPADVLAGRIAPRLLARFGGTAQVQNMRFFRLGAGRPASGSTMIVLAVLMRANFVHLAQFTMNGDDAPVEWSVPAAVKLQMLAGTLPFPWRSEWTADADGKLHS